jgi:hypothetical protein
MLLTVARVRESYFPDLREAGLYARVREGTFPLGVICHVGRRVYFNEGRLATWIEAGGSALPGGWRREPVAGPPNGVDV